MFPITPSGIDKTLVELVASCIYKITKHVINVCFWGIFNSCYFSVGTTKHACVDTALKVLIPFYSLQVIKDLVP